MDIKKRIEGSKRLIREALQKQGIYSPELVRQIEVAAKLRGHLLQLEEVMHSDDYAPVCLTHSREGFSRYAVNPLEEIYRKYMDQYQRSLKALRLNFDAKGEKAGGDGFGDFLDSVGRDD